MDAPYSTGSIGKGHGPKGAGQYLVCFHGVGCHGLMGCRYRVSCVLYGFLKIDNGNAQFQI